MKKFQLLFFSLLCWQVAVAKVNQKLLETWKNKSLKNCERNEAFKQIDWEKFIFFESQTDSTSSFIESLIDSAITYNLDVLKTADSHDMFLDSAYSCKNLGQLYIWKGQYNSAVDYLIKALFFFEEVREDEISIEIKLNLSVGYKEIGDFLQSKNFAYRALNLARITQKDEYLGLANMILASIYIAESNFASAERHLNLANGFIKNNAKTKIFGELQHKYGELYFQKKEYSKSIEYLKIAINHFSKINHSYYKSNSLSLLAKVQIYSNEYENAKLSLLQAQSINIHQQLEKNNAINDMIFGLLLTKKGDFREAERQLIKANSKIEKLGSLRLQKESQKKLYQLYDTLSATLNNPQRKKHLELAFYHYKNFVSLKDKIYDINNARESARRGTQIRYERKILADSLRNADIMALNKATIDAQEKELALERTRKIALVGILIVLTFFAIFAYNRYLHSKKQKEIIKKERDFAKTEHQEAEKQKLIAQKEHEEAEKQKKIVEQKNNEILDSINYAKRIQNTILPTPRIVESYLEESFIIYIPKDIVAGDFFWMESIETSKTIHNNVDHSSKKQQTTAKKILFAAADCTGHGVPGALISIFCNNGLNRSVKEFGLTKPSDILDKTKEIVLQEFEKSEDDVKDGMDIALCSIEKIENSNLVKLEYAGANNPLWIISNNGDLKCNFNRKNIASDFGLNNSGIFLYEISADKQPIGKHSFNTAFTNHEIILSKNDTVYVFSDGFADQFGGKLGAKLKSRNFKKLLLSINHLSMIEQKDSLVSSFYDWKGKLWQVDDVCVIGVKVS
jgi:serine phosphatase RsbU (regulator of sigma subunit)